MSETTNSPLPRIVLPVRLRLIPSLAGAGELHDRQKNGRGAVDAGWLPCGEVSEWLAEAGRISQKAESAARQGGRLAAQAGGPVEVVFYPVAASSRNPRACGAVLVLEGVEKNAGVDPGGWFSFRVQRLIEVWPGVLAPAGSRPSLELTEEEQRHFFPWKLHFFHPVLGVTGFEERDALRPWQLLVAPVRRGEEGWMGAVPGPEPAPALTALSLVRERSLEDLLAEEAGDIGVENEAAGGRGPVAGLGGKAAGIARGLLGGLGAAVMGAAGQDKVAESLRKWSSRSWSEVKDLRNREFDRLLERFEKDPLTALRKAIPLTGAEARRGVADRPGWRLGARTPDFHEGSSRGGEVADVWDIPSRVRLELERRYRESAAREAAAGEFGRAAYIYAELLGDWGKAAEMLEKAGRVREAAQIYRERLHSDAKAAECLERCGLLAEAAPLYRASGQFEKAGDLYAALGEEALARPLWKLALKYLTDPLAQAALLEQKLREPLRALAVLDETMRTTRKAQASFEGWFALAGRLGRADLAAARLESMERDPGMRLRQPGEQTAGLLTVFRSWPDPRIRKQAGALALRLAGEALERNAASEDAVRLLRLLPEFERGDRLLSRDAERFSLSRNRLPVPLASTAVVSGQKLRPREVIRLDPALRWESLSNSPYGPHVAGWSPGWTAERKYTAPVAGPVRQGHRPERLTWPGFSGGPASGPGLRHLVLPGRTAHPELLVVFSVAHKSARWSHGSGAMPVREQALALGPAGTEEFVLLREPATGTLMADYFGSDGGFRRSRVLDFAPAGMERAEWFTAGHGKDLWIAGMQAACCVTAANEFQQTGLDQVGGLAVAPPHLPSMAVVTAGNEVLLLLPRGPRRPLGCVNLFSSTGSRPPVCAFTGDGRMVAADAEGGVVYEITGPGSSLRKTADILLPPLDSELTRAAGTGDRGFAFLTENGAVLDFDG